jgi:hypothetical protein
MDGGYFGEGREAVKRSLKSKRSLWLVAFAALAGPGVDQDRALWLYTTKRTPEEAAKALAATRKQARALALAGAREDEQ